MPLPRGPRLQTRRIRARARREFNAGQYEVGLFDNASNPEHALKRAKQDVANLDKKLPLY